jgi:HSP20 family protein
MATWEPFDGFQALQREIASAFERASPQYHPAFRAAFLPGRAAREYPLINVYEEQDRVHVEALAPGADPRSFNITMIGRTLTICGEKPRVPGDVKPEAFHREERAAGRFNRSIEIPAEVEQGEGLAGQYKNGLLLVSLPKSEKAKPKQIKVQVD